MKEALQQPIENHAPRETEEEILLESRCPDVQEIIGGMPPWIIIWGATVITFFLLVLLVGAYFIPYPDSAMAGVQITCSNPPSVLKAQANAPITRLLVKEKEQVKPGQIICISGNETDFNAYQSLTGMTRALDSALDLQQVLSEINFDQKTTAARFQPLYQDLIFAIHTYKSIRPNATEAVRQLALIRSDVKKLMEELHNWRDQYLLISNIEGEVSYIRPITTGYFASSGEELVAIMPSFKERPLVTGRIKEHNRSKIKQGQTILIDLQDFPPATYGHLRGTVDHISAISVAGEYIVEIGLQKGLRTTANVLLPYRSQLLGTGNIITQNQSTLQYLLHHYVQN